VLQAKEVVRTIREMSFTELKNKININLNIKESNNEKISIEFVWKTEAETNNINCYYYIISNYSELLPYLTEDIWEFVRSIPDYLEYLTFVQSSGWRPFLLTNKGAHSYTGNIDYDVPINDTLLEKFDYLITDDMMKANSWRIKALIYSLSKADILNRSKFEDFLLNDNLNNENVKIIRFLNLCFINSPIFDHSQKESINIVRTLAYYGDSLLTHFVALENLKLWKSPQVYQLIRTDTTSNENFSKVLNSLLEENPYITKENRFLSYLVPQLRPIFPSQ